MWAAIFVQKEERDLLSLISLGIEFQRNDPSFQIISPRLRQTKSTWNVLKIIASHLTFMHISTACPGVHPRDTPGLWRNMILIS
jgi:hypothetical protein